MQIFLRRAAPSRTLDFRTFRAAATSSDRIGSDRGRIGMDAIPIPVPTPMAIAIAKLIKGLAKFISLFSLFKYNSPAATATRMRRCNKMLQPFHSQLQLEFFLSPLYGLQWKICLSLTDCSSSRGSRWKMNYNYAAPRRRGEPPLPGCRRDLNINASAMPHAARRAGISIWMPIVCIIFGNYWEHTH